MIPLLHFSIQIGRYDECEPHSILKISVPSLPLLPRMQLAFLVAPRRPWLRQRFHGGVGSVTASREESLRLLLGGSLMLGFVKVGEKTDDICLYERHWRAGTLQTLLLLLLLLFWISILSWQKNGNLRLSVEFQPPWC